MEARILNFPNAMKLSSILYRHSGQYSDSQKVNGYIIEGISKTSPEEMEWIVSLVSPVSFTTMGKLEEIISFIVKSKVVQLMCSRVGGIWQA